jgi:uncharacterized membrane protein YkvI
MCGGAIAKGGGFRKRVYTGSSVGGFNLSSSVVLNWLANSIIGRRRVGVRSYYSYRTVCQSCAAALDEWERKKLLAIGGIIGALLITFLVYISLAH